MIPRRTSFQTFFAVSALLFAVSAALTTVCCVSMSTMGDMPMPGGWTISMAWMRMPGQSWPGAATSFLAMWVAMMVAMMLPSLVPTLWRFCQAGTAVADRRQARPAQTSFACLTALVAIAYFLVWTVIGMAVFPLGVALASIEVQFPTLARAVPVSSGVVVLIAGALQFTTWKAHHLACCRLASTQDSPFLADARTAWRLGLRLGFHCSCRCASFTAILLVIGLMDLRAMALVTSAITAELLAPASEQVARAIGIIAVGGGVFLVAQGAGMF